MVDNVDKEITIGDLMKLVADGKASAQDAVRIYAKQPKAAKYEVWRGFRRVAFSGSGCGQVILEHADEYETRLMPNAAGQNPATPKALLDFLYCLFLVDPQTGEPLTMSRDPAEDTGNGSYRLYVHNADQTRQWMHTITTEEV